MISLSRKQVTILGQRYEQPVLVETTKCLVCFKRSGCVRLTLYKPRVMQADWSLVVVSAGTQDLYIDNGVCVCVCVDGGGGAISSRQGAVPASGRPGHPR